MLIRNSETQLTFLRKYCAQKDHRVLLTINSILFLRWWLSRHHIQGTDCKQGNEEPRDQEGRGSKWLSLDVLYGAQLCVH